MITEQQIVVTTVLIVTVGLVAMFLGRWWGIGQGREQGYEEREREEAKARRTRPAYRPVRWEDLPPDQQKAWPPPPEVTHNAWLPPDETVLNPTAVLSPDELSTTAWTRRMAEDMDRFLRDLIGGTDETLRGITR